MQTTDNSPMPVVLPLRSSVNFQRKLANVAWRFVNACVFPLTYRFNGLRRLMLRLFGGRVAAAVRISPSCRIEFPANLDIGFNSSLGHGVYLQCLDKVRIGENVCISDKASILTGSHDLSSPSFDLCTRPVVIESYCWIAYSATLLPGVVMASGGVAGAGAVIAKSTGQNEIWLGNPARQAGTRLIREEQ